MRQYLLPEGNAYKANLHCHTTVSDGAWTPEEVKREYKARGYSVVAFTDHEILLDHANLCEEGFLALNGYETSIKQVQVETKELPLMKVHHINLIKKRPGDVTQVCFFPENFTPGNCGSYIPFVRYTGEQCKYSYDDAFTNHLIREAKANGFLVHYNHPHWSNQEPDDILRLEGIDGIELVNTDTQLYGDNDAKFYAAVTARGMRAYALAADDNHNKGASKSFGAYTVIKAPSLSYESITNAIEKGDCYASTGAEIRSLYVEDGKLFVHTSPASVISLHSKGREFFAVYGEGGYVDKAAFPLDFLRLGGFFRIEVRAKDGSAAYSRAYFKDELRA